MDAATTGNPDARSEPDSQGEASGLPDAVIAPPAPPLAVNEELRAVFDAAADAILTLNRDGRVRNMNRTAEQVFGYNCSDCIGQNLEQFFDATSGATVRRALQAMEPDGPGVDLRESFAVHGQRASGERFPLEISLRTAAAGQLVVMLGHDMTRWFKIEPKIIDLTTRQMHAIGREIHESLGQQLSALTMLAACIKHPSAPGETGQDNTDLAQLRAHLEHALATARGLSRGLAPVAPDAQGLVIALADLTQRMNVASPTDCEFRMSGERVPEADETAILHLYHIAQEALTNALRHASATKVLVRLKVSAAHWLLTIRDNGCGLPGESAASAKLGLHVMRYRAQILGGKCSIETAAKGGTLVRCQVPAGEG